MQTCDCVHAVECEIHQIFIVQTHTTWTGQSSNSIVLINIMMILWSKLFVDHSLKFLDLFIVFKMRIYFDCL